MLGADGTVPYFGILTLHKFNRLAEERFPGEAIVVCLNRRQLSQLASSWITGVSGWVPTSWYMPTGHTVDLQIDTDQPDDTVRVWRYGDDSDVVLCTGVNLC